VKPEIEIVQPTNGIYIKNKRIIPLPKLLFCKALILGDITVKVKATDENDDIDRVEFRINNKLVYNTSEPDQDGFYTYEWKRDRPRVIHIFILKVTVYDSKENRAGDDIIVRKFL